MLSVLTIKDLTDKYFEAFENKDLDALSQLYSEDVLLNEWNENRFYGRGLVLEANDKLLNSTWKDQKVEIAFMAQGFSMYSSLNEIAVIVDGTEVARVVDVIEFSEDGKIKAIVAYRGF